jgi:Asp-tRNA(Asn)/Glu-tRNA(Gln) amidotransferase A subunit family amidase
VQFARGVLTSEQLVLACLERIDARDRKLQARVIAAKSKRQSNRGREVDGRHARIARRTQFAERRPLSAIKQT